MSTKSIVLTVFCLGLIACSGQSLSGREKGVLGGAAIGSGLGAIIGHAAGSTGAGIAIGGAAGALSGGLIGNEMDNQDEARSQQNERIRRQDEELRRQRREINSIKSQQQKADY